MASVHGIREEYANDERPATYDWRTMVTIHEDDGLNSMIFLYSSKVTLRNRSKGHARECTIRAWFEAYWLGQRMRGGFAVPLCG